MRNVRSSLRRRCGAKTAAVLGVVAALAAIVVPAVAAAGDAIPRAAVIARSDVPADALAAGPVAALLGAPVLVTPPSALVPETQAALQSLDPDLVVLAGGEAALSPAVADQVDAAGDWDVRRVAGDNRHATAAELAAVLAEYGIGQPVVTGPSKVVGDVTVDGHLSATSLDVVEGIDATTLDGHAVTDFEPAELDLPELRFATVPSRDLTSAEGAVTLAALPVELPDQCGGGTWYHVLLEASGYVGSVLTTGTQRVAFRVGRTPSPMITSGPGYAMVALHPASGFADVQDLGARRLLVDVPAGSHEMHLVARTEGPATVDLDSVIFTATPVTASCTGFS